MTLENKNFSVKNGLSIVDLEVISSARRLKNLTFDTADSNTLKLSGNQLVASAGSATITIPNSTDTLVGRNTTDTLTNKTLGDFTVTGRLKANNSYGSDGQILKATGSGITWADTFNGLPRYALKTSSFTAISQGVYFIDTSLNEVVVTLPDTTEVDPSTGLNKVQVGEGIEFIDAKGTWGTLFVRLIIPVNDPASFVNQANITDTEYNFDVSNAKVTIIWDGTNWRVFAG